MALAYKPHTVSVQTASQKVTSNTVSGRTLAAGVDVVGQMTPGNARSIYEQYNIELAAPMLFLCDPEDFDKFTLGSVVTKDGEAFVVTASSKWDAIAATSCGQIILEKQK